MDHHQENEQSLRAAIHELQDQVTNLTSYISSLQFVLNNNLAQRVVNEPFTQQFFGQSNVTCYLPFTCPPEGLNIQVMIEEQPGRWRQVNPAISFCGNAVDIWFDACHNGYVVVQPPQEAPMYDIIPVPPPVPELAVVELLEPFNPPETRSDHGIVGRVIEEM